MSTLMDRENKKVFCKSFSNSKESRLEMLKTGRLSDCEFIVGVVDDDGLERKVDEEDNNEEDDETDDNDSDDSRTWHSPRCSFKCHRMVLASASEVFERMFYGELAPQPPEQIIINDVSPEIFEIFLKYIYTYDLLCDDWRLSVKNCGEMLYLGDKYMIQDFTDECVKMLEGRVWLLADIFPLFELACLYENLPLMLSSYQRINDSANDLLDHQTFFDLNVNNLKRLMVLLAQNRQVHTNKLLSALELYGRSKNLHEKRDSDDFHKLVDAACQLDFNKLAFSNFNSGPAKSYLFHKLQSGD